MSSLRKAPVSILALLVLFFAVGCDGLGLAETCDDNCNEDEVLPYNGVSDLATYIDNGTLAFSNFSQSGNEAAITVSNNSQYALPIAIGAYAMADSTLEDQDLHDKSVTVIEAGEEAILSVELPENGMCTAEIDVFYDRPDDGVDGAPDSYREEDIPDGNPYRDAGVNFLVKNLMATTFFGAKNDKFEENDSLSEDNDGYEDIVPANRFCSN